MAAQRKVLTNVISLQLHPSLCSSKTDFVSLQRSRITAELCCLHFLLYFHHLKCKCIRHVRSIRMIIAICKCDCKIVYYLNFYSMGMLCSLTLSMQIVNCHMPDKSIAIREAIAGILCWCQQYMRGRNVSLLYVCIVGTNYHIILNH